jgi:hypothetical protein
MLKIIITNKTLKNNNKLTLKSLQQELEIMKAKAVTKTNKKSTSKTPLHVEQGHDIKNSYIKNLYTRSSGLLMYLVTGVLAYATKIPLLRNLISLLGLYYGKTTIWKFLSGLRKVFIVINAIIGVFIVFKTAGFSTENLLVGWLAVGETYLQTLGGLAGRLFKWFAELLDHKIVPNIPGDSGGSWYNKPLSKKPDSIFIPSNLNIPNLVESDAFSLRKLYMNAIPANDPWYRSYSTWLWIIGGVSFVYFGYKILSDPTNILDIGNYFKGKPSINTHAPTPPNLPDHNINLAGGIIGNLTDFSSRISGGLINAYKSTMSALNPFNYFVGATELQNQFNIFMDTQYDYIQADRRFYPFTEVNPFNSWFKRLRISYFGETMQEWTERTQFKMHAERVYESIRITKGKAIDVGGITPIFSYTPTASFTPVAAIGLHPSTSSLVDAVNAATVSNTLSNIPNVPNVNPDWSSHIVTTKMNIFSTPVDMLADSGTDETVTEAIAAIPKSFNPFSLLEEGISG